MKVLLVYDVYKKATNKNFKTLLKKRMNNRLDASLKMEKINDGVFQISGKEGSLTIIKDKLNGKRYHNKTIVCGYALVNENNFLNIDEYIFTYLRFIELERKEEKESILRELENLSDRKREQAGKTFLNMAGFFKEEVFQGFLYLFHKKNNEVLGDNIFSTGDIVSLSSGNPLYNSLKSR